jgi:hypothetical protein
VGTYETGALPRLQLVTKMIGKDLDDLENLSKFKVKTKVHDEAKLL